MKDDDFKLLRGFGDGRTNERTDICDCRVAFSTENDSFVPLDFANTVCMSLLLKFGHVEDIGARMHHRPFSFFSFG